MSGHPRIAIIGGMGPLASAAFVNTLYERAAVDCEQEAPPLILWSDPSFPDRTTELLAGRMEPLVTRLEHAIEQCCSLGVEHVVVCCVTIHAVIPLLPPALQNRIISLVDVLLGAVAERRRPVVLLATTGTRQVAVLERHALWPQASRWLRWPDEHDQQRIHRAIYQIKRNRRIAEACALVRDMVQRYSVDSFAAGCTELHLVQRAFGDAGPGCIDPLAIIAERIVPATVVTSQLNAS
jgi:aspartate racemase